jgi:hypothetical protein
MYFFFGLQQVGKVDLNPGSWERLGKTTRLLVAVGIELDISSIVPLLQLI